MPADKASLSVGWDATFPPPLTMSMHELAPSASVWPRPGGDVDGWSAAIYRMNKHGMDTALIAHVLGVSREAVVATFVKRRRVGRHTDCGDRHECDGDDARELHENEARSELAARLLRDPCEFCCPILNSLMEDPVVAEDGYTYEREAIVRWLNINPKSPMKAVVMGQQVLPNQHMRTQISNYVERTVDEIISVVPGHALRDSIDLLERAASFCRALLPSSGARRRLVEVLQLRSQLPPSSRGNSVSELIAVLAEGLGDGPLAEEIGRIRLEGIYNVTVGLSDKQTSCLHVLVQSNPVLSAIVGEYLYRQLARRLALRTKCDGQAAQELWQITQHCRQNRINRMSVLLAIIPQLVVNLNALDIDVLERTEHLARHKNELLTQVTDLLGSNFVVDVAAFEALADLRKSLMVLLSARYEAAAHRAHAHTYGADWTKVWTHKFAWNLTSVEASIFDCHRICKSFTLPSSGIQATLCFSTFTARDPRVIGLTLSVADPEAQVSCTFSVDGRNVGVDRYLDDGGWTFVAGARDVVFDQFVDANSFALLFRSANETFQVREVAVRVHRAMVDEGRCSQDFTSIPPQ